MYFLGYSKCSRTYMVYNIETLVVKESIQVRFNDKELEYTKS